MAEQLASMGARLRALFAGFTTGQKAMTGLAVAGLLLGFVLLLSWVSTPSYAPLFTGLASSDAAAVTEELNSRGMSYELADGGRTILVPRQDVYQLRLDMSAAGLPESGKSGYALLDEGGITTSEFKQRVDYQRALEGELASTIGVIEGVSAATVHLVMPEETLFADDNRHPSASVLLRTASGQSLSASQVQAVVHLVASSVEGLDTDHVTVADAEGRVLSAAGEEGQSALAANARSTQTQAFQQELADSVEDMLAQVVGPGGAVVRVKARLDFDTTTTTTQTFETEEQTPTLSESTTTETYTGNGTAVGGVLGPENRELPEGGESEYNKETAQRTYAVGKVTETVESAPGQVRRLSVAVMLDSETAGNIPPAEISDIVTAATGLNPERGDVIEVSRMPFDDSAEQRAAAELEAAQAAQQRDQIFSVARTVGVLLVVVVLALLALRALKRRERRAPVAIPYDPYQLESAGDQAALAGAEGPAAVETSAAPQLESGPGASAEDQRRVSVHGEINELVERQPDEVAQLLRGWLADRRT